MRFQDAARDARAIVYAGIQADPQVADAAELLADATPAQRVLARAVMNGETTDAEGWRAMFPTLFGPTATGDAAEQARSAAILDVSLAVADRGEQVRSQVRGAIVEELTARLLARRVGTAAVHRERRILFDGVRAEIHPYDVTVEREARPRPTTASGARGASMPTCSTSSTTRGRTPPTRTSRCASPWSSSTRAARARSGSSRQTAPHDATGLITLETLDELSAAR